MRAAAPGAQRFWHVFASTADSWTSDCASMWGEPAEAQLRQNERQNKAHDSSNGTGIVKQRSYADVLRSPPPVPPPEPQDEAKPQGECDGDEAMPLSSPFFCSVRVVEQVRRLPPPSRPIIPPKAARRVVPAHCHWRPRGA